MSPAGLLAAPLAVAVALGAGVWLVAVIDILVAGTVAGSRPGVGVAVLRPVRAAALRLLQRRTSTERPDWQAWALAPALLVGLGATMLTAVPLDRGVAVADVPHGVILLGAAAAMVIVPVFLAGWSPNSYLSLVGGYRMFAQALSYMIPLALVLIGAALPAESLAFGDVVADQQDLWNVVRMPLGLPVYLVAASGLAFWGPLSLPSGTDLSGGIDLEASSVHLAAWRFGQRAVLVGAAAVGAAAFLGGWAGPVLPGAVWTVLKTALLLAVLVAGRHLLARIRPERFVVLAWTVLMPAALVDIFATGAWLL